MSGFVCDKCKKETPIFELHANGKLIHEDTLFTIHKRKMYECEKCFGWSKKTKNRKEGE